MQISALKENSNNENRVALTPDAIKLFQRLGLEILIEDDAGNNSGYPNELYKENGAKIVSRNECLKADICLCVKMPNEEDLNKLNENTVLIGILNPYENKKYFNTLNNKKIISCCMELIPRISRAQSMDVLSSQANLAGYRSVIDAAEQFGKAFPMMMTAAGRVNPAKVMVLGVGVAGLQAIATAKRLGAVVYASDVRKSAAEQIESVGGRFIEVDGMDDFEDESGYAKPLTPEFIQKVNDTVCEVARDADVIITTARIFGRPAPITVPASAVANFKTGSVVVDMNADVGGNCELTRAGEVFTTDNGVTIVGTKNLPGELSNTASMLFSNNMTNFVSTLVKEGKLVIDMEDDVLVGAPEGHDFYVQGMGGVLLCSDGSIHPKQSRLSGVL